MDFFFKF